MVTWGVTAADGGGRTLPLDYVVEATNWLGGPDDASDSALPTDERRLYRQTNTPLWRHGKQMLRGTATALTLPVSDCHLNTTTRVTRGDHRTLDSGHHRLRVTVDHPDRFGPTVSTAAAGSTVTLDFGGPATVERRARRVSLSFPRPTAVTMQLLPASDGDPETVTITESPEGLAAGLTAMGAAHETLSPARSHPARRSHPPLLEYGDTVDVPPSIERSIPDTDIELVVPSAYEPLFVGAPLAYYLGASVRTADVDAPRLRSADGSVDHRFEAMPAFQHECASLLQQVFYLDCLVRDDQPTQPLLDSLDLAPATLRAGSPVDRLARYLDVTGPSLAERLPGWPLSTYATPTPEHVPVLPYLLDDMSLVYLPAASELDSAELLDRSLSDTYRACGADAPAVDVLEPDLRAGKVHAWLADGTPIDAYKTTPVAYENRQQYRQRPSKPFTVTVVLNDETMADEHSAVAAIYRERAADLPIDVTVREHLSVEELASEIETPTDFLHYIGHCETDGLRCVDGTLSTSDLTRSQTRTFFLNACGSYHEGLDLVEQGSLAGAVTLKAVLNKQAATVGTAFARLVMHGFSIERAMQLARRRILMGKDYAVVGDGTDALVPVAGAAGLIRVEDDGEQYHLTYDALATTTSGRRYDSPFSDDRHLCGQTTEQTVSPGRLESILEATSLPVIYNGTFHWSRDLAARL